MSNTHCHGEIIMAKLLRESCQADNRM